MAALIVPSRENSSIIVAEKLHEVLPVLRRGEVERQPAFLVRGKGGQRRIGVSKGELHHATIALAPQTPW
jgi:hypothetical protein